MSQLNEDVVLESQNNKKIKLEHEKFNVTDLNIKIEKESGQDSQNVDDLKQNSRYINQNIAKYEGNLLQKIENEQSISQTSLESTSDDTTNLKIKTEETIKDSIKLKTGNEENKDGNEIEGDNQSMSKSKRKKLLKMQKWEIRKKEKRLQEREKQKRKKKEAIENGIPYKIGPSRKSLKHLKMSDSNCRVTVAIDLSFDHLMIDKDIAKVVKQMLRVYTLNRRAENPIQLCFTSLKEGSKMHTAISKHDGYKNWDVRIEEKSFQELYPQSDICYLTSESDNILNTLDPNTVYIIGGLVDHNSHKGLCYDLAKSNNLRHAQLPLDQLLLMKTRRVLTIDHVFEILLRVTEGKTWTEAFLQVLPMRKGAQPVEEKAKNETKPMVE